MEVVIDDDIADNQYSYGDKDYYKVTLLNSLFTEYVTLKSKETILKKFYDEEPENRLIRNHYCDLHYLSNKIVWAVYLLTNTIVPKIRTEERTLYDVPDTEYISYSIDDTHFCSFNYRGEFQSIVLFVEKLRKIFGHFGSDIKFDKTKEYINFIGGNDKKNIPILELQKCLVTDVFLYLNYEENQEIVLEIIDEMFEKCYEKS